MEKILGVVGGIGPEAGLAFCQHVARRIGARTGAAPHIILDSLSIPREKMIEFARGGEPEGAKEALLASVRRLNLAGASAIAIPCNTVHVFMGDLRAASRAPIISIIDETANACGRLKAKKVCLLATSKTLESGLYHARFAAAGIDVSCPGIGVQRKLEGMIIGINSFCAPARVHEKIAGIAVSLAKEHNAGLVVLGCTDLGQAAAKIRQKGAKAVDSLEELEKSAVSCLMGDS